MRILCFGDSNTWGYIPLKDGKRTENRWTKVLATLIPDEIIEEGLNSRTMYSFDENEPWKTGFSYILPCLETHDKIDIVIFMLGTNDLKNKFNNTAEDMFKQFKDFTKYLLDFKSTHDNEGFKLIVSGIPKVDDTINYFDDYENTSKKRDEYNLLCMKYCLENNIPFIDNSELEIGGDGVHLTEQSHLMLAVKLESIINEMKNL